MEYYTLIVTLFCAIVWFRGTYHSNAVERIEGEICFKALFLPAFFCFAYELVRWALL